jgi:uncharacterized protein YcbK (DUF882 family)
MTIEFNGTVYFTRKELESKGDGMYILSPGFAENLLALRLAWGRPMNVTSGCRSTVHNANEGGSINSWHICDHPDRDGSCAVDIWIPDSAEKMEFMKLASMLGWSVGIPSAGFIHIDRRADYGSEQLVFGY